MMWKLYSALVDVIVLATGKEDINPAILSKIYDIAKEVVKQ